MATKLQPADVALIGLGASGGTAALPLAQAGLRVVGLEAGGWLSTRDFPADEIRNDIRNWMGPKAMGELPTWRSKPGDEAGRGAVNIPMMNAVGGTSIHYGMEAWRMLPWNLRSRSATIERYGDGMIPADSTVADWPLAYEDLEPYYDRVDKLIGISGKAGNLGGTQDEAGNIYEGPRSSEYPLPPLRRTPWLDDAAKLLQDLGNNPFPGPASIRSEAYEGKPGCSYCGFCTYNGCHIDAKGSTSVNGIPEAQAAGLEIVPHARVTEILVDSEGRASGVRYVRAGQEYEQPAKLVVLASYTYENVRLLLLSKSKAFPDGLANGSGQVGKHYMSHNYVFANVLIPGKRLGGWGGPGAQRVSWDDQDADNFDHSGLGFIAGGIGDIRHGERKPIGASRSTPPSVRGWGSEWKAWLAENADSVASIGYQAECLPYEDAFIDLDPVATDPYGVPRARVTFDLHEQESLRYDYLYGKIEEIAEAAGATEVWPSFPKMPVAVNSHAYGGTRMGDDPDTSVVDGFGVAHEVPGLVVLGGSTFPTSSGYNPTLTIQALAWRTADHVVERFGALTT